LPKKYCELNVETCGLALITLQSINYHRVMAAAGYSGTTLLKKLGIKPETKLWVLHAPDNYAQLLESPISEQFAATGEVPDMVHLFAKNSSVFVTGMKKILPLCKKKPAIIIWVSWYKRSAGIATDLTENMIRDLALRNGLVDIKVCAVSDSWSGLKLVVPLSKR
jgi:hypothetical protein